MLRLMGEYGSLALALGTTAYCAGAAAATGLPQNVSKEVLEGVMYRGLTAAGTLCGMIFEYTNKNCDAQVEQNTMRNPDAARLEDILRGGLFGGIVGGVSTIVGFYAGYFTHSR